MVAQDLQSHEDTCSNNTQHILTSVAQHHTGYGWRNKAQGQQLPDVTSLNDDEIVTAECPQDGT